MVLDTSPHRDELLDNSSDLEESLLRKFRRLTGVRGELVMPCVPAMIDQHLAKIKGLLVTFDQEFTPEEFAALEALVKSRVEEGFEKSPFARLVVRYEPPSPTEGILSGLKLSVNAQVFSMESKYQKWITSREGPLFGSHPEAKVMAVAQQLSQGVPVLDVGAGVGRNSIPLAKKGHPVDAIEMTPEFCQLLLKESQEQSLPLRVIQGDVLNPRLQLPQECYHLGIVSGVISHFRNLEQVQNLFTKLSTAMVPGGFLLVNVFLTNGDYQPDEKARQLSQVQWSYFLTREEWQNLIGSLPLTVISDESVHDYELEHLPAEAWPPTTWFINWSKGRDVFHQNIPPIELRWLLLRRV